MKIEITEQAIRELRKILCDQPRMEKETYLRLGIKPGGCSGFTYTMDLSHRPEQNDAILEISGIHFLCDPVSRIYLDGLVLDFRDEPIRRGFLFHNPHAREICPCGVSFGI